MNVYGKRLKSDANNCYTVFCFVFVYCKYLFFYCKTSNFFLRVLMEMGVVGQVGYTIAFPQPGLNKVLPITKTRILKFHHQKNENFQIKNSDIFHISAQNIDCGYSLEPPQRGGSNEYPQYMF